MTCQFLNLLILKFPNDHDLGKIIRKFYTFSKDRDQYMDSISIEETFLSEIFNEPYSFQST